MSLVRTPDIRTFVSSDFRHPYVSENPTLGSDFRHFTKVSEIRTQKFGFQTHFEKCMKTKLWVWILDNFSNPNCLETQQLPSVWNPYQFRYKRLTVQVLKHLMNILEKGCFFQISCTYILFRSLLYTVLELKGSCPRSNFLQIVKANFNLYLLRYLKLIILVSGELAQL